MSDGLAAVLVGDNDARRDSHLRTPDESHRSEAQLAGMVSALRSTLRIPGRGLEPSGWAGHGPTRIVARLVLAATTAVTLLVTACGGGSAPEAPPTREQPTLSTTDGSVTATDPMKTPTVDGRFAVDGKRNLALRCWGQGSPVIVYDAGTGTPGLGLWPTRPVMTELARTTQVCTYDRAGLGESDPPPNRKRVLDDAVQDLHQLLAAGKVPGPYVLVGSSGGGFNVYQHAGRFPKEVAGLVMLDVPRGQAKMSAEDIKALAWDAPDNPEHMDYVAIERQMALHRLPIPAIPVTVITASAGQSADKPDEQKVWLAGSSHPVHVVLSGGHEIYDDDPQGVIDRIHEVVSLAMKTR
jgi:hypothetical protein